MSAKRILLVDDDRDFVTAQDAVLRYAGFETFKAHSGTEGFQKAKEIKPDLIVLDVNMETHNAGFVLNRQIRRDKELANTPIVMLTGIETYPISAAALDMYNTMKEAGDIDLFEVLKVSSGNGDVAVQYRDEKGGLYYLPLDSFVSKDNVEEQLLKEIERLIK